jgi:4-nitrophenyl phosphatase
MSSAYAAAYFTFNKFKAKKAFVIGEDGLTKEIENFNIKVLDLNEVFDILNHSNSSDLKDIILVSGLDREFNYIKLKAALRLLLKGAKWVACNLDPNYPLEDGIDPGAGAIAGAIGSCAGYLKNNKFVFRYPDFVAGKPSSFMLELLLSKNTSNALYVGDRLDVDIPFAKSLSLFSVLVLSGISKKEDLKKFSIKPDAVLDSVSFLPSFLEKY